MAVKAVEEDVLAEAKAAAEAAKLELEAAKLRAEAEKLERASVQERRAARAKILLGGEDGGVSVGLEDLKARLKDSEGVQLTDEQATTLMTACGRNKEGGALFFDDLAGEAFDAELRRIAEAGRAARQEEQAAQAKEAAARTAGQREGGGSQDVAVDAEENDDRGISTRLAACLAYFFVLADAFRYAAPLAQLFPPITVLLAPVGLFAITLQAIPFGSLLVLVLFIVLAQNKDVPRLVRFNLEQAVLLDCALILPNIIVAVTMASGGAEAVDVSASVTFLTLCALVAYCVSKNINGEEPDGIPVISDTAKNVVDRSSFF